MKKQIIIAIAALGAFVFGINNTQAQTGTTTDPVSTTVNIILADVISIESVNSPEVSFSYTTSADYNEAKEQTIEDNIVVTSSTNFDVKVKAEESYFLNSVLADMIPVNVIKVKAVAGGTMDGTFNEVTLTNFYKVLVSNATLGARKSLSIVYSISADKASTVLLGKAPGTYTQEVKYTATAL